MSQGLFSNQLGKIRYAAWEWLIMRIGFAGCVWMATWHTWRFWQIGIRDAYERDSANGLPFLLDLGWVGQPVPTAALGLLMGGLLVLYVMGRALLPVTGGLCLIHAVVGGIFSSPRGDHHATQVVGLVLLGQFAWFAWARFRPARLRQGGMDSPSGAVFWSQQMICAGYMISAVSKWVNSGGGLLPGAKWVAQLPNIAVQFEKNRLQAYYDHLTEPVATGVNAWMTRQVIETPATAIAFLAFGFYIELLAFLALFNRQAALLVGLGLMSLHGLIFFVMHLPFYYFEAVDLLFLVNLPFWIAVGLGRVPRPGSVPA